MGGVRAAHDLIFIGKDAMFAKQSLIPRMGNFSLEILLSVNAIFLGLGIFLGLITVSMCQQWLLIFGQDAQISVVVSIVLSLALWAGQRWQSTRLVSSDDRSLASLVFCLSSWTILHPYWIDSLTVVLGFVPLQYLEANVSKLIVFLALATFIWTIPAMLCAATITQAEILANRLAISKRKIFGLLSCGIGFGLIMNSLGLAPLCGSYFPALAASVIASFIAWRWRSVLVPSSRSLPAATSAFKISNEFRLPVSTLIQLATAFLIGSLFACNLRLANQLMPHGAFVIYVQLAGVFLGIALGIVLGDRPHIPNILQPWSGMFAALASSALLALQPLMVIASLWMNTSLPVVALLLAARSLLLIAICIPFGMSLAWIAASPAHETRSRLIPCGAFFSAGMGIIAFLLGGFFELIPLITICGGSLLVMSGYLLWISRDLSITYRNVGGMTLFLAIAISLMSLPFWNSCDDASRTAKLLFSTPAFVAYRSGWSIEHLPFLDDIRLIGRREGKLGPMTLWRGRVAELHLREAGIPRATVTKDSNLVPQFPAEVLQVVYPLMLSEKTGRILFLGLSSGVPITTCLSFPIQEAVCLEGDLNLIEMVRGPLCRETGYDPLNDERVTLRKVSSELALMAKTNDLYDIVISSPMNSSMSEGAASYTEEYYHRASQQLSAEGIFCQRFESIDYGPGPVQLVLKAVRKAFRQVIAVEMAAGELLIMGSNSEKGFTTEHLLSRLETPHVRRVLAKSGLDWSTLLNFASYDDAAIQEICDEKSGQGNSALHGQLAAIAPLELMRWGNKPQEVQSLLTTVRVTPAPYWFKKNGQPKELEQETHLSRRSRMFEWLDDTQSLKELSRRMGEVEDQYKLVQENPDLHWRIYRKTLRKQLQDRPRSAIQQVKAVDQKMKMHPEDRHRRDYFVALGNAGTQMTPTREQIAKLEEYLEPYDPLVSYFGRQETADLLARCGEDAARELAYRLYVIYFAPPDASVRNVAKALETLVKHPEAVPDDGMRFDALNGLIQTMRIRWEIRQNGTETSSQKILNDVDLCLIAVEKGVSELNLLAPKAGVSQRDWQTRKNVIDRLMLRPLRTYRDEVQLRQFRGQAKAREIIEEAGKAEENEDLSISN